MSNLHSAISPKHSVTVSASAGTGKTWLLVSRLLRMLLEGVPADAILAITFTRKAAAEMRTRLSQRLLEIATCADHELDTGLAALGLSADPEIRFRARNLYETLLHETSSIRLTTFHAFCQDVLRRFPLEADIPPGFELLDSSFELQTAAMDALWSEASLDNQGPLAEALLQLTDQCGSLFNCQQSLLSFLNQRSDWWAFTQGQSDPPAFASAQILRDWDIDPQAAPLENLFSDGALRELTELVELCGLHPIKQNKDATEQLSLVFSLVGNNKIEQAYETLSTIFLTKEHKPRARKESTVQKTKMGAAGEQRLLQLHHNWCQRILEIRDTFKRLAHWQANQAWFYCGQRLLDYYQQYKDEQRLLDFSDLEWRTYQLLTETDHALWVQYKLDQRIDHLLVDEFQDTNPTQWHLLLPLLEEFAAGNHERSRSVFLVGDHKQSIYRFRRAEPQLFNAAEVWLNQHLGADRHPLNVSWRSAPAIMQFVNLLFTNGPLSESLTDFIPHDTHHQKRWGHVELLPLVQEQDKPTAVQRAELRNPLLEPRPDTRTTGPRDEANLIVNKIQSLVKSATLIGDTVSAHSIDYRDIVILLRKRTHAAEFEAALRAAGIPYVGAARGALLHSLEAKDMVDLLELLITPFNNLALAAVLRSPLFDLSDETLMQLAEFTSGIWLERLDALAIQYGEDKQIQRAHHLLSRWRSFADKLPVHDLLDKIYFEGNVNSRYTAAYPAHLQLRAKNNLMRFLELALETDSGRYPSIGHFIRRLHSLKSADQDAPDEPTDQSGNGVRIMTIHAAKGLEAPVVFLADTASQGQKSLHYKAIVNWPAEQNRPANFFLTLTKQQRDSISERYLDQQERAEHREEANLLYVAVTRAKQLLFISGHGKTTSGATDWYQLIQQQMQASSLVMQTELGGLSVTSGSPPSQITQKPAIAERNAAKWKSDSRLTKVVNSEQSLVDITPSDSTEQLPTDKSEPEADEDRQQRGIIIHQVLQKLSEGWAERDIQMHLANSYRSGGTGYDLQECIKTAIATFKKPQLSKYFAPDTLTRAYNEVPLHYQLEGKTVYGQIDRLLVSRDFIELIDYKTHRGIDQSKMQKLAERYQSQLQYYAKGISQLWPGRTVRACLIFTDNASSQEVCITSGR